MNPGGSGFYWDSANPTPVIEFSLAAGALTVSTKGVCKVLFPKQGSPGLMQEIDLSGRSYTIASGAMIGRHGTTPSVAWGSAMPLFVYLVNSDNTFAGVQISLSRDPRASLTPTSEDNIGIAGSAAAVSAQGNHFQSGAAKLENVPCVCIGSLTATIDDSLGGVFTFGALASTDGFGKFQEGVQFTFPEGQNGATAGSYFSEGGAATSLDFATMTYVYTISRDGTFEIYFTTGARSAGDVSNTDLYIHLPYTTASTLNSATGTYPQNVTTKINGVATLVLAKTASDVNYFVLSDTAMTLAYDVSAFANAADYIRGVKIRENAF